MHADSCCMETNTALGGMCVYLHMKGMCVKGEKHTSASNNSGIETDSYGHLL